jgi:hypothetical protein
MSRFLLIPAMRRARIAPFNGSRLNSTLEARMKITPEQLKARELVH